MYIITDLYFSIVRWLKSKMNNYYTNYIGTKFSKFGKGCSVHQFNSLCGSKFIDVGDYVRIGSRVILEAWSYYPFTGQTFNPHISIGDNSSIGDDSHIGCINYISIGNGVRMGRKVFITDHSHGTSEHKNLKIQPNLRYLNSKGPIIIEDNVWIGEMACIMPGVTIGTGSIVGANAVVTKDIPRYSIAVGNPAKVIKTIEK